MIKNNSYRAFRYGDELRPGYMLQIEHSISSEQPDISSLITKSKEELEAMRQDSISAENKACAYLFDPEKSQIVFMMSFMASTGIIVGLVLITNLFIPVKSNILLTFNIILAISVVWFFISYRIAVAVYQNRDMV